jgi:hypothetical protein
VGVGDGHLGEALVDSGSQRAALSAVFEDGHRTERVGVGANGDQPAAHWRQRVGHGRGDGGRLRLVATVLRVEVAEYTLGGQGLIGDLNAKRPFGVKLLRPQLAGREQRVLIMVGRRAHRGCHPYAGGIAACVGRRRSVSPRQTGGKDGARCATRA